MNALKVALSLEFEDGVVKVKLPYRRLLTD